MQNKKLFALHRISPSWLLNMVIELNKKYVVRNGGSVLIRFVIKNDLKPFIGDIVDVDGKHVRVATFSHNGGYSQTGTPSRFDIVSEY